MHHFVFILALVILINSAAYELPVKEDKVVSFLPDSYWTSCDYFDLPERINVGSISYDIATGDISFLGVDVGFFNLIRKVVISVVKKAPSERPTVLKRSKVYITPGTSKFPYKDKNRFVVDYFDSKFANKSEEFIKQLTKEFSYLKEVLQMSRDEDWFKPIYNEYLNPTKRGKK